MKHQPKPKPKPPRRPRNAAMKDDQGRDDQGERARAERGVKPSSRPASPREPRHNSDARARHRPSNRPEPPHRRRHSRDRSRGRDRDREHDRHPSPEPSRRATDTDDLIPRYRAGRDHHRDPDKSRRRSPSRSRSRDRAGRDSLSPIKRQRSRSPSAASSHRKKSRRDRSPRGRARDYSPESTSRKHGRHSSRDRRKSSPRRYTNSSRSPSRVDDHRSRSARRSRSRSQTRGETGSRRADREARPDKPRHRSQSRSGESERRQSSSRRPRPSSRGDYSEAPSSSARDRPSEVDRRSTHRHMPPRSPKFNRDRKHRDDSPDWRHSSKSDMDEEMTSRGSHRGGYNPKYSHKSRGDKYSQSPQHGGSYQTSPSQSPYGANRGNRGNQQYSPQQQYPPQYNQGGNHGPPNGPSGHYYSNQPHSPPHSAPNGPTQQYSQGGYRGGYRGGFRGGFQGRGGNRAGFKNAHWSSGNQGSRGHYDDSNNGRFNSAAARENDGDENPDAMDIDTHQFHGSANSQADELNKDDDENAMSPPSRQPPSGPQSQQGPSGKFSFAFKTSSKPTPTAPKPEISQKFNAAPQRRESPKENRDREPHRAPPTEPASARSRHDFRNPPDGPRGDGGHRVVPRMRKVKKIMKRPKERMTLPTELVASESVFFRKPGNESVVGSGTYGKVFKGLNVYTKGLSALKRIRMEGERDGFPVTAVREIKLLQSLRHVNIVNLQEVMVEKNDCFMVFEYMSHDLTGLLNHPSFKLDAAQRKHMAKQLFQGLDYLHTRGVLHRDIKAANILVSNEGVLKLADFGLARFYAKRHQLDYTNRVITIWYRSPELLLGETKYTAAVDVWSAACVMIEIFTRNAIFPGDGTELSQLEKIYNLMGTPNTHDWPGLVDMAWFELLRPTAKRKSVFGDKYRERVTPEAFDLLAAMFRYDPAKRPTAAEVLQHAYFTAEEPPPRQAIELAKVDGDWHEFESKALRKENERRDREARRAAREGASRDKEKKRANDGSDHPRDAKRVQVEKDQKPKSSNQPASSTNA